MLLLLLLLLPKCVKQLYEEAWSQPRGALLLDDIMAEDHQQIDQVWQGGDKPGIGRKRMKRGILAYRSAYPDIRWEVQQLLLLLPRVHACASRVCMRKSRVCSKALCWRPSKQRTACFCCVMAVQV